ncbi:hypothetical protein BDB01DRAFT_834235 [Pilobolus umbonatus]|nr:hypothetical protein BDB01DRAFT_834235 [Pilobolus umbonatus]
MSIYCNMYIEEVEDILLQTIVFSFQLLDKDFTSVICAKMIPLRDHSGGRPKCSHPLKSVEELTGGRECGCYDAGILVVVVIMFGLSHTFGIRWLLTFSLVDPVIQVLSVLEN